MKSELAGRVESPTTIRDPYMWGGATYPSYQGRLDASAVAEPVASPAAVPVTPAAAPASPAGGVPGASPTPAGGVPNPNDANLATLRTNYERLKPWEAVSKLGDPTKVQSAYTTHTKMFSEATQLAEALGYTAESLAEAFAEDPADVLAHLRAETKRANPNQQVDPRRIESLVNQGIKKAMTPVQEQINKQQTDTALAKMDSEFSRLITDKELGFGDDCPPEIREAMYDLMDLLLPDSVIGEIKTEGKVSGVAQSFSEAKTAFLKAVNSYNSWQAKRAEGNRSPGGPPQGGRATGVPAPNGNKPVTIDDIMNDPEAHLPGLKKKAY